MLDFQGMCPELNMMTLIASMMPMVIVMAKVAIDDVFLSGGYYRA